MVLVKKKVLTLLIVGLLFVSFLQMIGNYSTVAQSDSAELIGVAADGGRDTDSDGKHNYLDVAIEINVSVAGNYRLEAHFLEDEYGFRFYYYTNNESFLTEGLQWLNLSFSGFAIYANSFNPESIGDVWLYWEHDHSLEQIDMLPVAQLSRIYNYTEFDSGATLTGSVTSEGVDTDGDGLFNSLWVGVEVNVTDAATYEVDIWGLYGEVYIDIHNYSMTYLTPGIQTVNVSLPCLKMYASHGNFSFIDRICLRVYEEYSSFSLGCTYGHSLNRSYSYVEFDPMAFLTGRVLGVGIDEDVDGLFDYLQISVEVNVTDAGFYIVEVYNLLGNGSLYLHHIGTGSNYDVGIHLVNFSVYGPRIYAARIDPAYVEPVRLFARDYWGENILLEDHDLLPLLPSYYYYDFESHAFLTGRIYHDKGVDTDADGLFDYLEVGVEVNVTEAGVYQISASGLAEEVDGYTNRVYYSQYPYPLFDLDVGIHIINFTFPGPMIAYNHINPMNVTDLRLIEYSTYTELSYIHTASLSTKYNYTLFNSPLNDVQLELTVYPNATIGVSSSMNHTHMYIPSYYHPPMVNATLGFSTSEHGVAGALNGTMTLPDYYYYRQFPYNSTTVGFASEYNDGILDSQLNATMFLPHFDDYQLQYIPIQLNNSDFSFLGAYSNKMFTAELHVDTKLSPYLTSQFPFNATDLSVLAEYSNNRFNGTITFHIVAGFPLQDIVIDFSGNKTDISFTGSIEVIYGTYYNMEINETIVDEILTEINSSIPGRGDQSLYNMTDGFVECTILNTTKTPLNGNGTRIYYNATIRGNYTQLLSEYLTPILFGYYAPEEAYLLVDAALNATLNSVQEARLELGYWHTTETMSFNMSLVSDVEALWSNALQSVPSLLPPEYRNQSEVWLTIANITAYAVEDVNITAAYSGNAQKLDFYASLSANITQLEDEILPILPDALPPMPSEYRDWLESCINTTYCTLESLNLTCAYVGEVVDFDAEWFLQGDFKAELNRIKSCYVKYLELTVPYSIGWEISMLNATIIDLSNFTAQIKQGKGWLTFTFDGLVVQPPKDEIDSIRFILGNWLTMTGTLNFPREFEKLKIRIVSGFNGTHTILLSMPSVPPPVPTPDTTSLDYKVMTWENVTAYSLRNLLFKIAYQGVIHYPGKTYYVPIFTNSTVSNFFFNQNAKKISFQASGTNGTGFCNVTIPRDLLYASPSQWVVLVNGTLTDFNVSENSEYAFIYFDYNHSTNLIEIVGTWAVTEFPIHMLTLALVIVSLAIIAIAITQRKKLALVGNINLFARFLRLRSFTKATKMLKQLLNYEG